MAQKKIGVQESSPVTASVSHTSAGHFVGFDVVAEVDFLANVGLSGGRGRERLTEF